MKLSQQLPTAANAIADRAGVGQTEDSSRRRKRKRLGSGALAVESADASSPPPPPLAFVLDTRPSESLARLVGAESSDTDSDVSDAPARDQAAAAAVAAKAPRRQRTGGKAAAVWQDDDDASGSDADIDEKTRLRLKRSLRQRRTEFLAAFGPTPHYLDAERILADRRRRADGGVDEEEEEEETRALQVLAPGRTGDLPPRQLAFQRLAEANKESPSHRRLTSVRFNPRARVLLTASTDQRFALFQVDADRPVFDRLHSQHMPGFPVLCARFTPDGNHVVLASIHRSFKLFDILTERLEHVPRLLGVERNCKLSDFEISPDQKYIAFIGKYGEIYLVDFKTRNRISTLRSSSATLQAIAFSPDGQRLLAGGSDGQVSEFSMRHNHTRCVSSFRDEGSTGLTSLAAAQRFVACGSSCGIVNLYTWEGLRQGAEAPKPQRTAKNLTTECTSLRFNHTEELLLMASGQEPQAVRLWHLGGGEVMQNFPPPKVRHYLAAVHSADFSPSSGFMCLGQHTGRAALFRLEHYASY